MTCKMQIKHILAGLVMALAIGDQGLAQSSSSRTSDVCESTPSRERTTLTDLEMMSRAEKRLEALQAKLFELHMREIDLQDRLDDLDYWLTTEGIQRSVAFIGSPRPMDEFREASRKRFEAAKERVNKQLEVLASFREKLEAEIRETELELARLRQRFGPQ